MVTGPSVAQNSDPNAFRRASSQRLLGTDRHGSWTAPRGELTEGRQSSVFANLVGRDVVVVLVCHLHESTQEVHRNGIYADTAERPPPYLSHIRFSCSAEPGINQQDAWTPSAWLSQT